MNPSYFRHNTLNFEQYSIKSTTGRPGEEPFVEFFDGLGNLIGHIDVFFDARQMPQRVIVPREHNTEEQHRLLDKAVEKLREISGKVGNTFQYTPITVQEIDLVQVVQGMSPARAKGVLQILARTLEETLRTERTKEKK